MLDSSYWEYQNS